MYKRQILATSEALSSTSCTDTPFCCAIPVSYTHLDVYKRQGVLETFENKHPDNDYFVKFNCPEFTSLCPITGQPDFATIYISYIPDKLMVESKSLKLYLFSFRNHGDFHEDCVNIIMKDLIRLMQPRYIEVWGKFTPRGGISIDPYCNYGKEGTAFEMCIRDRH